MEFILTEHIKKDANVSEYMRERAKFFGIIQLFGVEYYIPITNKVKKAFNIKIVKGRMYGGDISVLEDFIRDIINSVYLQVRDVVGADVYKNLSNEIKEKFENFFSDNLENVVMKGLNQKMLPAGDSEKIVVDKDQ